MTFGGNIFRFAICLAGSFLTVQAMAQGDPVKQFDPAAAAVRRPGTTVRIDLIGDSTQTDHAGYGRGLCANLTDAVDCVNMAKGGASTRSFRAQGLWERSLETKPDYMLIQFGHNDQKPAPTLRRVPSREGEYALTRHEFRSVLKAKREALATFDAPTQAVE